MKFDNTLNKIEDKKNREMFKSVLVWIDKKYPDLNTVVKWNKQMFTDHDTFIIGFDAFKNHMSITPEKIVIERFSKEILNSGYEHSSNLFKIKWTDEIDFNLLETIIDHNILDKKNCTSFFR